MKSPTFSLLLCTFICAFLFCSTYAAAQCMVSPSNIYTFQYQGKKYELIKDAMSWSDAAACALSRGAELAVVNDQVEQDSIFHELSTNAGITLSATVAPDGGGASYVWLGGNDIASEGNWIWDPTNSGAGIQFWMGDANGSPVGGLFNNWGKEPDNFNNQDGLGLALTQWPVGSGALGSAGQWNDVDDSNMLFFLLEYDSIPSGIGRTGLEGVELELSLERSSATLHLRLVGFENSEVAQLVVYDLRGTRLFEQSIRTKGHNLDCSMLSAGIYLVKCIDPRSGQLIASEKFSKI